MFFIQSMMFEGLYSVTTVHVSRTLFYATKRSTKSQSSDRYKNMELFNKVDEYNQISCTQPGLYSTLLSFPHPPAQKNAKSLGKVATYESRQAATAIRSDTSGPGCLKGGQISILWIVQLVFLILNICWAVIYLVDSNIQHLHNPGLDIIWQWLPLFATLKQCPLRFTITGHCTLPEVNQGGSNTQCTPPPHHHHKKKKVLSRNKITPLREGRWMIIIWG